MADKEPNTDTTSSTVTATDTESEQPTSRLVKSTERSNRKHAQGRMDHTTKVSYWCIGIIVIILLFYFLGNMITDAEALEGNK